MITLAIVVVAMVTLDAVIALMAATAAAVCRNKPTLLPCSASHSIAAFVLLTYAFHFLLTVVFINALMFSGRSNAKIEFVPLPGSKLTN